MHCLFRVSHSGPDQLRDEHDRKLPLFVSRTHNLVYWSLTTALMHYMRVELVDALYIHVTMCRQYSQRCHLIPLERGLSRLSFVHFILLQSDYTSISQKLINFTVCKFPNLSHTHKIHSDICKHKH